MPEFNVVIDTKFIDASYKNVCLQLNADGSVSWYIDKMREVYD